MNNNRINWNNKKKIKNKLIKKKIYVYNSKLIKKINS